MFLIAVAIGTVSFSVPIGYPQDLHWTISQGIAPLAKLPTCSTASNPCDLQFGLGHLVGFGIFSPFKYIGEKGGGFKA